MLSLQGDSVKYFLDRLDKVGEKVGSRNTILLADNCDIVRKGMRGGLISLSTRVAMRTGSNDSVSGVWVSMLKKLPQQRTGVWDLAKWLVECVSDLPASPSVHRITSQLSQTSSTLGKQPRVLQNTSSWSAMFRSALWMWVASGPSGRSGTSALRAWPPYSSWCRPVSLIRFCLRTGGPTG